MPLSPVSRSSLTDEVFDQIVDDILAGDLLVGDALPSERALAEALGVSRPAVREALKRLAQSRLVTIRQGESTTVSNFRETAGLDLLPHLLFVGGELDPAVVRSIIEVRQLVGPMVAGLAAERATPGAVEELGGILDGLSEATDDVARQRIALRFWDRVVDTADSIALRLMFNALRDAYEPVIETTGPILHDEVTALDDYQSVVNAIEAQDRALAEEAAARLLSRGSEGVSHLLERLSGSRRQADLADEEM